MDDKVGYWLDLADYDLETAKAMFQTGRYLYVAFMCHQAVEKCLKAAWQAAHLDGIPPKTHNLEYLASQVGLTERLSDRQLQFLAELEPLNVESRYPTQKNALFQTLGKRRCSGLIGRTSRMVAWIRRQL
jgi:HEPN domain-containing protein